MGEAEEAAFQGCSFVEILRMLRRLSLDEFGLVMWSMPDATLPGLSRALPAMPSTAVQERWTGASGLDLLRQSTWFPRLLDRTAWQHWGRGARGATVLDVGCGYGRLVRLMYYFADPDSMFGVEPWEHSFEQCRNLPGTFALVDDVPQAYPIDEPIDLAYAFSVFTHLSEDAMRAVLAAVRKLLVPDGMFVCTIRPVEYWAAEGAERTRDVADEMTRRHLEDGFAHATRPGREHYGDTSMSLEFVAAIDGWRVLGHEWSVVDPLQVAVIMAPA